jgi:uncharacterized protein YjbI with pentapeptide repeats
MANPHHVQRLLEGAEAWNEWRTTSGEWPDLRGASLRDANLVRADLAGVDLTDADLRGADLEKSACREATLVGAALIDANLVETSFFGADLTGADLTRAFLLNANLRAARLQSANLTDANLAGADLQRADFAGATCAGTDFSSATMVGTSFASATLTGCRVYGVSPWDVDLTGAIQRDLIITPTKVDVLTATASTATLWMSAGDITVDDLEVAQFVALLLRNEKLRRVIDTMTAKMVLILGRFTSERKAVLDAVRDALRQRNLLPVIFDFERPAGRDITETVRTLAHLSRFIIADLTDPSSIPHELMAIVPLLPSVPVVPVIEAPQQPWAMFADLRRYPWVLPPYEYVSGAALVDALDEHVIGPGERARTAAAG